MKQNVKFAPFAVQYSSYLDSAIQHLLPYVLLVIRMKGISRVAQFFLQFQNEVLGQLQLFLVLSHHLFPRLHGHQGEGSEGLPDHSYAGLLVKLLYR